ncbi:MAG: aa3-type cytochrome c oxidase subunit IV [Rhodospirillales bacterium]|nr:MAG: aa3-type cytochrome c oxidase subunit IV [Rhodospirillales bacterium]
MASHDFDMRQYNQTYAGVLKLITYTILALIVIVVGMAFALVAHMPVIGLGGMILGLIALTIAAAVLR